MNFDLCKNKYFHIAEGNMNIEVDVHGKYLVYGLKTLAFESKKLASKFLNELFNSIKNAYEAEKMNKKDAREFVCEVLNRVFH